MRRKDDGRDLVRQLAVAALQLFFFTAKAQRRQGIRREENC
jgi:hypothetical protein